MLKALQIFFGLGPTVNARVVVRGNVYEGGYVQFAQKLALKYGLMGWMRPEPSSMNQHIEMEVQGAQVRIEKMLELLQKGTPHSRISKIDVEMRGPKAAMPAFRIRH